MMLQPSCLQPTSQIDCRLDARVGRLPARGYPEVRLWEITLVDAVPASHMDQTTVTSLPVFSFLSPSFTYVPSPSPHLAAFATFETNASCRPTPRLGFVLPKSQNSSPRNTSSTPQPVLPSRPHGPRGPNINAILIVITSDLDISARIGRRAVRRALYWKWSATE